MGVLSLLSGHSNARATDQEGGRWDVLFFGEIGSGVRWLGLGSRGGERFAPGRRRTASAKLSRKRSKGKRMKKTIDIGKSGRGGEW